MATYKIGTKEGADFAAAQTGQPYELDDVVELDLTKDQDRAVVAAGWLEPDKKKEK